MVQVQLNYPIGTRGKPWGVSEKQAWFQSRKVHRSYNDDVVKPMHELANDGSSSESNPLFKDYRIVQYGSFQIENCDDLPLLAVVPRTFDVGKPAVLVTGGTHGYETSGVMGALQFLSSGRVNKYTSHFNLVVVPCVCPWGYERIERWVSTTVDPNRAFGRVSPSCEAEETNKLMSFLDGLGKEDNGGSIKWLCHVDLHETTNSDVEEFRPAKAARDGATSYEDHIPDGFYLVGDSVCNETEFYAAILEAVRGVTHIAEMDSDGTLSGYPATSHGLILVPKKDLGLCAGGAVPGAKYLATTEVYPDSDGTSANDCIRAQVEAVCAAFDHILKNVIS